MKQRADAADDRTRRLTALFDNAADGILFFTTDGRYVDANPAASTILGRSRQEILASKIGDFSPPDERSETAALLAQISERGPARGTMRIVRKDGSIHHIQFTALPDVLPGLHCIIGHDVTTEREAEKKVHLLSARLLKLQDEERRRIARQLHETVAQSLAAIRLNLSRLKRFSDPAGLETLNESKALVEQAIAEIRTISYLLHPPMMEAAGLLATLRWYVNGFAERSRIDTTLDVPPAEELDELPDEIRTAVFRIVQEALTNIQRHSDSAVAHIVVRREGNDVALEIRDEGRGLPEELRANDEALRAAGVGVAGMYERVRELGGTMEVHSTEGGTTVAVTLPVQR